MSALKRNTLQKYHLSLLTLLLGNEVCKDSSDLQRKLHIKEQSRQSANRYVALKRNIASKAVWKIGEITENTQKENRLDNLCKKHTKNPAALWQ